MRRYSSCIYCEANLSFLRADLNAKLHIVNFICKSASNFCYQHHHNRINRNTSTARHRLLPRLTKQIGPAPTHLSRMVLSNRPSSILLEAYPNTVSSSPWMPVKNFLATGHRFRRDVPSLLPLSDSSSYVGNSNSGTDLIISDMNLQTNSEHSNLQRYSILTY